MGHLTITGGRRFFDADGYPGIELDIPGWPALLDLSEGGKAYPNIYTKTKLVEAGFTSMGAEVEDILPVLIFPADPANGLLERTKLRGFTDDPAVAWLMAEAREALSAEAGYERELTEEDLREALDAREN